MVNDIDGGVDKNYLEHETKEKKEVITQPTLLKLRRRLQHACGYDLNHKKNSTQTALAISPKCFVSQT